MKYPLIVFMLLLISCSDDSENSVAKQLSIVGKWQLSGTYWDCGDGLLDYEEDCSLFPCYVFEFLSDKTYELSSSSGISKGTYEIESNSQLTLKPESTASGVFVVKEGSSGYRYDLTLQVVDGQSNPIQFIPCSDAVEAGMFFKKL